MPTAITTMLLSTAPMTWKDVKFEFTVNKTGDSNAEGVTIYSNPSNDLVTTYDVDDFALYKRIDVTYSSGTAANLPAGASDPATHGGYMDDGFTTLAAAKPVCTDKRRLEAQ